MGKQKGIGSVLAPRAHPYVIVRAARARGMTSEAAHSTPYVTVRTHSEGTFSGRLESWEGQKAVLLDAQRLHNRWSLSGAGDTRNYKLPATAPRLELWDVIEVMRLEKL